jgi:hypothetical protein
MQRREEQSGPLVREVIDEESGDDRCAVGVDEESWEEACKDPCIEEEQSSGAGSQAQGGPGQLAPLLEDAQALQLAVNHHQCEQSAQQVAPTTAATVVPVIWMHGAERNGGGEKLGVQKASRYKKG